MCQISTSFNLMRCFYFKMEYGDLHVKQKFNNSIILCLIRMRICVYKKNILLQKVFTQKKQNSIKLRRVIKCRKLRIPKNALELCDVIFRDSFTTVVAVKSPKFCKSSRKTLICQSICEFKRDENKQ